MSDDVPLAGAPGRVRPSRLAAWWDRDLLWDVYVVAVAVVASVFVMDAADRPTAAKAGAISLIVALLAWYAGWRRSLYTAGGATWRGYVYLAGATVLFAAAVAMVNGSSFLLLMLCPQAYILLRPMPATGAVIGISTVYLGVVLLQAGTLAALLEGPLPVAAMAVVASVVFGTWSSRVAQQNDERAELIRELEASRADVARLSRDAGMIAERQRLAGELHDTIAQGLSSVIMLMQAAEAELHRSPQQAQRHLALAIDTARDNLEETRALVGALTPAALDDTSLNEALSRLADRLRTGANLRVAYTADDDLPPLSTALEVVLLRAAQESLSNVRKHADATSVDIRLHHRHGKVLLQVRDDGRGFSTSVDSGGYGLGVMRARVEQVAGTVSVASEPGAGTVVRVEVPVP